MRKTRANLTISFVPPPLALPHSTNRLKTVLPTSRDAKMSRIPPAFKSLRGDWGQSPSHRQRAYVIQNEVEHQLIGTSFRFRSMPLTILVGSSISPTWPGVSLIRSCLCTSRPAVLRSSPAPERQQKTAEPQRHRECIWLGDVMDFCFGNVSAFTAKVDAEGFVGVKEFVDWNR